MDNLFDLLQNKSDEYLKLNSFFAGLTYLKLTIKYEK